MPNRTYLGLALSLLVMTTSHAYAESKASKDGRVQIEVPEGWHASTTATSATLRIEATGAVIEILNEAKIDFDNVDTLPAYADSTLKSLAKTTKLSNRVVGPPHAYKLGDRDVLEYKITGSIDNRKSVLVYTFLETGHYWNCVVGSTSPSLFDEMRPAFDTVAKTFRELTPVKKR